MPAVAVSCSADSMPYSILRVCKVKKMLSSPAWFSPAISAGSPGRLSMRFCSLGAAEVVPTQEENTCPAGLCMAKESGLSLTKVSAVQRHT